MMHYVFYNVLYFNQKRGNKRCLLDSISQRRTMQVRQTDWKIFG